MQVRSGYPTRSVINMTNPCSACDTPLPPDAAFCFRCGTALPGNESDALPGADPDTVRLEQLQAAIGDRYVLRRTIGTGGMATVYEADDPRHRRRVAIKVLHAELAATMGAQRFLLEIETAAGLNHPHILPIHDSGEADGELYYVMPLVDGETLEDRIARRGPLLPDEAIRLAGEVAEALDYAHGQNVIHRDIKPGNVLLQAGHALVTDFGIARALKRSGAALTEIGYSVGTPQYMSPEQALGETGVDGRTDIYAVGTMLYEMLTGRVPFDADTAQAVFAKKVTHEIPAIDTARLGIPPVLERVIRKAMAGDPGARYPTAAEFVDALVLVDMNVLTEGVRDVLQAQAEESQATVSASEQRRIAVVSGVSTAAVLALVYIALQQLGLPIWVFGVLAATVAIGGPVVHILRRAK
jgi:serine/threonine protein kinase